MLDGAGRAKPQNRSRSSRVPLLATLESVKDVFRICGKTPPACGRLFLCRDGPPTVRRSASETSLESGAGSARRFENHDITRRYQPIEKTKSTDDSTKGSPQGEKNCCQKACGCMAGCCLCIVTTLSLIATVYIIAASWLVPSLPKPWNKMDLPLPSFPKELSIPKMPSLPHMQFPDLPVPAIPKELPAIPRLPSPLAWLYSPEDSEPPAYNCDLSGKGSPQDWSTEKTLWCCDNFNVACQQIDEKLGKQIDGQSERDETEHKPAAKEGNESARKQKKSNDGNAEGDQQKKNTAGKAHVHKQKDNAEGDHAQKTHVQKHGGSRHNTHRDEDDQKSDSPKQKHGKKQKQDVKHDDRTDAEESEADVNARKPVATDKKPIKGRSDEKSAERKQNEKSASKVNPGKKDKKHGGNDNTSDDEETDNKREKHELKRGRSARGHEETKHVSASVHGKVKKGFELDEACNSACIISGVTKTCKQRVEWLMETPLPEGLLGKLPTVACEEAANEVAHRCNSCSDCPLRSVCDPERFKTDEAFNCLNGESGSWSAKKKKHCCKDMGLGCR